MLCKNHSPAISRRVEPQGVERKHVEQRMIKISHRIGEVFSFCIHLSVCKEYST